MVYYTRMRPIPSLAGYSKYKKANEAQQIRQVRQHHYTEVILRYISGNR